MRGKGGDAKQKKFQKEVVIETEDKNLRRSGWAY
jgi:hypothetical protein